VWEQIVADLNSANPSPEVNCVLGFEAYSESRQSVDIEGMVAAMADKVWWWWCSAVSCGEPPGCGGCLKGAQNLAEEGLF